MLEHHFGVCRQQVADFDTLNFLQMASRVATPLQLEAKAEAAVHTPDEDDDRPARGYHHTYNDLRHVDINALSSYPTESEFAAACQQGTQDAIVLLEAIGALPLAAEGLQQSSEEGSEVPLGTDWTSFLDPEYLALKEEAMYRATSFVNPEDIIRAVQQSEVSQALEEDCIAAALALSSLEVETNDNIQAIAEDDIDKLLEESQRIFAEPWSTWEEEFADSQPQPPSSQTSLEVGSHVELSGPKWPELKAPFHWYHPPSEMRSWLVTAMVGRRSLNECEYIKSRNERYGGALFPRPDVLRSNRAADGALVAQIPVTQAPRDAQTGQTVQSVKSAIFNKMLRHTMELSQRLAGNTSGISRGVRWTGQVKIARELTEHEAQKRADVQEAMIKRAQTTQNKAFECYKDHRDGKEKILLGNVAAGEETDLRREDLVVFVAGRKAKGKAGGRLCLGIVKALYRKDSPSGPHIDLKYSDSVAHLSNIVVQELRWVIGDQFSTTVYPPNVSVYHVVKAQKIIQKVGRMGTTSALGHAFDLRPEINRVLTAWRLEGQKVIDAAFKAPPPKETEREPLAEVATRDNQPTGGSETAGGGPENEAPQGKKRKGKTPAKHGPSAEKRQRQGKSAAAQPASVQGSQQGSLSVMARAL
ncbi:hypothetical protein QFC20_003174 [Naganishia adeliensis]|uniref:Uncharacterized protein n=1 Tax=Naganishia adeliensis TaxID=92952 RepID=A0ACC2WDY5_9TREE|nr:hypothetical protein QFC20_003174 [Naganishia adeliensis]